MIAKASLAETASFYHRYLNQIPDGDILELLIKQAEEVKGLLSSLPIGKHDYAYGPGKWTLKQLFGHMVDTERIMAYRALCIARGEETSLPGFDENAYVNHANFENRDLANIIREYAALRESNLALFASFSEEVLARSGMANNNKGIVRGFITVIAAHEFHHLQIIKQRYLAD